MYSVDSDDRVIELPGLPKWCTGAPLPTVVADDHHVLVAYLIDDPDPHWDGPSARMVSSDSTGRSFAVVSFKFARAHMFGAPNDEAFEGHPLYARGLTPYAPAEVVPSSWIRRLERMNAVHPQHRPEHFAPYRHFVLAFHDSTFECVAKSFAVTVGRGPMRDAHRAMLQMLRARRHGPRVIRVLALVLLSLVGCREVARDACLDRGGCWDHDRQRCEMREQAQCRPAGNARLAAAEHARRGKGRVRATRTGSPAPDFGIGLGIGNGEL